MSLRIRYRSSDDDITERVISDEVVEPPNAVTAHCHLRQERRTFVLSRIEEAVDTSTGEVVSDIWIHYGIPSLKPPPLSMPTFSEVPTHLTGAEAKTQRNTDKRTLFGRFKLVVISKTRREQLNGLFVHKCYKCGHSGRLVMDHHVPQYLGGRLVPGNVVLLCVRCNKLKHDRHPREFYSEGELSRLVRILEQELELFDFTFNWPLWNMHPKEYLLSLGVSEQDTENAIQEAARAREEGISVSFTVTGLDK